MIHSAFRTKSCCHCTSIILCCLGRRVRKQWLSPSALLAGMLHQSGSTKITSRVKYSNALTVTIRKARHENLSFFKFTREVGKKCSSDGMSRLYSTIKSFRQGKRRRSLFSLLQVVKVVCLVTGISFWIILAIIVLMIDELKLKTNGNKEMILPEVVRSSCFLGMREAEEYFTRGIYGEDTDLKVSDIDNIKVEIVEKINAFRDLWVRLQNEDGIQHSIGYPVDICGYKFCKDREKIVPWNTSLDEGRTRWLANCYIEGKDGLAILCVLFERHNTESEWVATKLHIEKIKESGEVICSISKSLPNGFRDLMCLSDV